MKLSLILPTNRIDAQSIANVIALAEFASSDTEVIISDNSSDSRKAKLLDVLAANWPITLIKRPSCSVAENGLGALACAKGRFVLSVADDDRIFANGLNELITNQIAQHDESAPIAYTAPVVVFHNERFGSYNLEILQSEDTAQKLDAWLSSQRFNHFVISPVQREICERHHSRFARHPYRFSFEDLIYGLHVITSGKIQAVQSAHYAFNLQNWASPEVCQASERNHYVQRNLDGSINLIHWLILTLEGVLFLLQQQRPDSEILASIWARHMMQLLRSVPRAHSDGVYLSQATMIRDKWQQRTLLDATELLRDVTELFRLAGPSVLADRYYSFWTT